MWEKGALLLEFKTITHSFIVTGHEIIEGGLWVPSKFSAKQHQKVMRNSNKMY